MLASMLLSRSLRKSLWNGDDWTAWCSEQLSDTVPKKAMLTLSSARQHQANLVRQHVVKKPALKRQGRRLTKKRVTPLFSVTRIHARRSAGVQAQRHG